MYSPTHRACARFAVARQQFLDAVTNYICQYNVSGEIVETGILDDLLLLLEESHPVTQRYVAEFIARFAEKGMRESEFILELNGGELLLKDFYTRELSYQRTAIYALASIGRHNDELTKKIMDIGVLEAILHCLECPDIELNTDAMYALRLLGIHPSFTAALMEADAGPLINKCLFTYDDVLVQWTLFAIGDIAFTSEEFAEYIASLNFLGLLKQIVESNASKTAKMWVFHVWSCFASHSPELAAQLVNEDILHLLIENLNSDFEEIRDKVLYALIQIAKHNSEIAMAMIEENILDALLDVSNTVSSEQGMMCLDLAGLMASQGLQPASKIADHLITRAMLAYVENYSPTLKEPGIASSCIWALGQIGKHSDELANRIARLKTMVSILFIYETFTDINQSAELHEACRNTLKLLIHKCSDVTILEHFIIDVPDDIQKFVVHALAKLISYDDNAKQDFLECGALPKIIHLPIEPGTDFTEDILTIVNAYPDKVHRRYRRKSEERQEKDDKKKKKRKKSKKPKKASLEMQAAVSSGSSK